MNRKEWITRGNCPVEGELAPGVALRVFVSGQLGADRLSSGTATFLARAELPYHTHPFSEAITVLSGKAYISVEGRRYQLGAYDAMHVPKEVPHLVQNSSEEFPAVLLWTFASDAPTRELVPDRFTVTDCFASQPDVSEHLTRFDTAPVYELAPQAFFRDLFAARFGSRGICGGYGVFGPGASLPCHMHGFDESITIVAGQAICQVAGQEYQLCNNDTACVPQGRPHRFLNRSGEPMSMIWVYAGDEPDRTVLDQANCEELLLLDTVALKGP